MDQFDLIVIGAGPGGYVAAIRAAQLGMKVACVEREPELGGTCLRVGCIPSKALLESSEFFAHLAHGAAEHGIKAAGIELDLPAMMARKGKVVTGLTRGVAALFKKNGVTRYEGQASLAGQGRISVSGTGPAVELAAARIIIATGSRSANLPGIEPDGRLIGTSTEALAYDRVPGHLVVIGAGYIGLEMAAIWSRLGAKVTVLECLERILPGMDAELAAAAQKLLGRQGIEFRLGSRVIAVRAAGDGGSVECAGAEPLACDRVLLAVGRTPNTEGLQLEAAGVQLDERGRIKVDEHYRTSVGGVFAIGDVIAGPMLAHKASEEGVACVELMAGKAGHVNYEVIPGVVYTQPEVASVGRTEEQLKDTGVEYRKGVFQFRGIGRARAMGQIDGFVKVLADAATDRILGVHIIGPRAGDLIAEAAAAMEFAASSEDLARCCHAHPTLAEAIKEACLAVAGRAINA